MKRNIKHKYLAFLLMLILTFSFGKVQAQKKVNAKKAATVTFQSMVTDETGKAVSNATVSAAEGSVSVNTATNGSFTILTKGNSQLLIEALGFEDKIVVVLPSIIPEKIVLTKTVLFNGSKDLVTLPAGIQDTRRNLVGAVSSIKGDAMNTYPDAMFSNTLQGKLLGLGVNIGVSGLANNPSSLTIRGNQRGGNSPIVTIVDGMERSINDIIPEEIESVEVLKDATAKILYGARAANGVLLITTKHGDKLKRTIKSSVEYGFGQTTRTPEYLDSYDYARLYNQARQHDGLSSLYSDDDLAGYQNSTGPNDFRYPNVDYSDYFLKEFNNFRKVTTEFSGGDEKTQYAFVAGYTGTDGLQTVGEQPQYNRLNLRGNLDVQINDMISGFMGLAAQYDVNKMGSIDHSSTYSNISSIRPNEYPLMIDTAIIAADELGIPALGASFQNADNLYGTFQYGGYSKDQNINGQTNFGLKFDFSKYLKGLSAKAYYTFDNSFYGKESLTTSAATYARRYYTDAAGVEQLETVLMKKTDINDNVKLSSTNNLRSTGWISNVNYNNTFGKHAFNADLSNIYLKKESSGSGQDVKTVNYVFRGNYVYNNKYILEGDLAYMGSSKFIGDNQFEFAYSGGMAWLISEEDFFKSFSNDRIDFLKLKASAGVLAYDGTTDYRLYQNRWIDNNSFYFNNSNTTAETKFDIVGNPDLKWEKSRQINIGFEALAFDRKLFVEANYFNELSYDQIQLVDMTHSGVYGGLYSYSNFGKVSNSGFELEARWTNKTVGGLSYSVGGNMMYTKNKVLKADEVNYPDDYLLKTNQSSDAMFGYVTEGIFGKDVELQGHAMQTFGTYGEGDLAYKDLNNDGLINTLDRKVLGNSIPRVILGIDINLNYKGWGLYALGTANLGVDNWLNNSYYWMNGESKYSVQALNAYDATTNPSGIYPALSTTASTNNQIVSDVWIQSADFFRLKNMELSYTFSNSNASAIAKSIKIFTRGTNLLVLSKNKDLDPEALNAGVTNYPVMRNFTAGISVAF